MQRDQRLRRRQDFAAVYGRGRAAHGDLVSVRVLRTDLEHTRFGFSVSKRVGKAVVRNRVKRRLRAAVTALAPPGGWDVVISARAPAATVPYDDLVRALAAVLRRARVLPMMRQGSSGKSGEGGQAPSDPHTHPPPRSPGG